MLIVQRSGQPGNSCYGRFSPGGAAGTE